jgi:hypothetical protein
MSEAVHHARDQIENGQFIKRLSAAAHRLKSADALAGGGEDCIRTARTIAAVGASPKPPEARRFHQMRLDGRASLIRIGR